MEMSAGLQIVLVGGGALATAIFGILGFLIKDVYSKVGDLGTLKEKVRILESHVDDNKKTSEVVIRMEEQVKNLIIKVEMLTAALLQDRIKPNV